VTRVLLADGALRVEGPPDALELLARWLPLVPYGRRAAAPHGAAMRLLRGPAPPPPAAAPTLRLGSVDAWVEGSTMWLHGATAGCSGRAELGAGTADLCVPDGADRDAAGWELFALATLASALLLGRMGRTLAHAAAVVEPGGAAWLLVGDSHAGKSTTVANLLEAGWRFVSDDNVVLSRAAEGGVTVEGWPRPFHLDEGWEAGAPAGRRGTTDPHARWPGRWLEAAPLAGLLFPRVEASLPTAPSPLPAAEALAGLLRQSPWLLADRASAAAVLALLGDTAAHPAFALRLGLDSYTDPPLLVDRLAPVVAP
jgi:hypothetical protein